MTRRYDMVVIGGGTAGLTAAIGAAGVGARVALVERDRTGGDCLWTGCVPSKSLLAAADLVHRMRTADELGLEPVEPEVDLGRIMERVRRVQDRLGEHDSPERLRRHGVEVVQGDARFEAPGTVAVDGRRLAYRTALIATGSRPVLPPIDGIEHVEPLTTDTVWELDHLPPRLVVLGGGPTGCELAQAFARLGSEVTLIEMLPNLLDREEPEAQELIASHLEQDGVDLRLGTRAVRAEPTDRGGALVVETGTGHERVPFDRVLVATGRRPTTTGLGLHAVEVELDGAGNVRTDRYLRTTGSGIFAAGDVTGGPPFTHVAAYEAGLVVPNALFHLRRAASYVDVPWVTFTDPEVGRVGLTEAQARQRYGEDVTVAWFDYARADRAVTAGRAYGFAKLVADRKGTLVGATVAAPSGGEAIAELAALVTRGGQLSDISRTVHAYPTFARGVKRAADEHLREIWLSERVRRIARPVLALLRWVERPR